MRLTAARVLGDGDDADGLGDGAPLPDALGVGSTVGPGDEETVGSGRPTVGVAPTSTMRGDGAPCTPTAPVLDDDADGPGAAGDDEVTGGGAATEAPPALNANALYARNATPSPAIV